MVVVWLNLRKADGSRITILCAGHSLRREADLARIETAGYQRMENSLAQRYK